MQNITFLVCPTWAIEPVPRVFFKFEAHSHKRKLRTWTLRFPNSCTLSRSKYAFWRQLPSKVLTLFALLFLFAPNTFQLLLFLDNAEAKFGSGAAISAYRQTACFSVWKAAVMIKRVWRGMTLASDGRGWLTVIGFRRLFSTYVFVHFLLWWTRLKLRCPGMAQLE